MPTGQAKWLRLWHRSFGGSTHFVGLVSFVALSCVPVETQLRRPLGHIFEYGLRPDFSQAPTAVDVSSTLSLEDFLHPHDSTRRVMHPITYYKNWLGRSGIDCR